MMAEAHLERPLLSMMTSARSMLCVLAAKASFRFCHVHPQGRLCTTTCDPSTPIRGSAARCGGPVRLKHAQKDPGMTALVQLIQLCTVTASWENGVGSIAVLDAYQRQGSAPARRSIFQGCQVAVASPPCLGPA